MSEIAEINEVAVRRGAEEMEDWFSYFKYKRQRDSPSNTLNVLLVVAALIATICFQVCLTPPDEIFIHRSLQLTSSTAPPPPAFPGPVITIGGGVVASISGSSTSSMFLFANSLGFTSSACIIIYMTVGFPFQRELHMALYSLLLTYGFVVQSLIKDYEHKHNRIWGYVLVTIAFTLPFALRWLPRWVTKAWNKYHHGSWF